MILSAWGLFGMLLYGMLWLRGPIETHAHSSHGNPIYMLIFQDYFNAFSITPSNISLGISI